MIYSTSRSSACVGPTTTPDSVRAAELAVDQGADGAVQVHGSSVPVDEVGLGVVDGLRPRGDMHTPRGNVPFEGATRWGVHSPGPSALEKGRNRPEGRASMRHHPPRRPRGPSGTFRRSTPAVRGVPAGPRSASSSRIAMSVLASMLLFRRERRGASALLETPLEATAPTQSRTASAATARSRSPCTPCRRHRSCSRCRRGSPSSPCPTGLAS